MAMMVFRLFAAVFLVALTAPAQLELPYRISTVAGSGPYRFDSEGALATQPRFISIEGAAVAPNGDLFFGDPSLQVVLRVGADGRVRRFAGTGERGFEGDGGPALNARLNLPAGIGVDAGGVVYFSDLSNHRVRAVGADGVIRTVAGTGAAAGPEGQNGLATQVAINSPQGLVVDAGRRLVYFAELNGHRVRRLDLATGMLTTAAGTGIAGAAGDGGPATAAQLRGPQGVGLAADGSLLIADRGNVKIRRVDIATGAISTFAGTGAVGLGGDGGAATAAQMVAPNGVAGLANGSVVIADPGGPMRIVSAAGVIRTAEAPAPAGANAVFSAGGNVFLAATAARLLRVDGAQGVFVAGALAETGIGDGGQATAAKFLLPLGVAVSPDGDIFVGDPFDSRVRRVAKDGVITTFGRADGRALAFDSRGRLYASGAGTIVRFDAEGRTTVVAGQGGVGTAGDGGPALAAQLIDVQSLAFDANDDLFFVDRHRIRRIDAATGVISTAAGGIDLGFAGDGGPAAQARLNFPGYIAFGSDGALLIADTRNNRVRSLRDGVVRTVAGNGEPGGGGDGGPATAARVGVPLGLAVDRQGAIYIGSGQTVRKVSPDGTIRTIAGTGPDGFAGDGGPAVGAQFASPIALAVDPAGVVFVADSLNERIRRLEPVRFFAEGLVNAANFTRPIAPGSIASVFGVAIAPDSAVTGGLDASGGVETTVGGVRVLFDGVPAPIFFGIGGQLNIQAPYELAGRSRATMRIERDGVGIGTAEVEIAPTAPGIFALAGGTGQVVAFNQDGTLNAAGNPERHGRVLVLFATGGGVNSPPIGTGKLASSPFPAPTAPVSVRIGGVEGTIQFAAGAPGFAGLLQVNVTVGAGTPVGPTTPIELRIGSAASPAGLTVAIAGP